MKNLLKGLTLAGVLAVAFGFQASAQCCCKNGSGSCKKDTAIVYYIKDITPENIQKVYDALGRQANGKVAVKISTGESSESNHLSPDLIGPFVKNINGTFIECNTAYEGNRLRTADHLKEVEKRGYLNYAPVDIMDATGDTAINIVGGKHLPHDIVGKNFLNYDFMVVLSHFKGHAMGGFGGALKNISIGIASGNGKAWIHSGGKIANTKEIWKNICEQDVFLESMADACKGVIEHVGKDNTIYINVANNLSVDCDCNGHPAAPQMGDMGIFASLDPVALDRACVDAVFNSEDPGKVHLIERINSRNGTHILDAAEELGLGTQTYKIVVLE